MCNCSFYCNKLFAATWPELATFIQYVFLDVACGEYFRDTSLSLTLLFSASFHEQNIGNHHCSHHLQAASINISIHLNYFSHFRKFFCAILNTIEIVSPLELRALKLFP